MSSSIWTRCADGSELRSLRLTAWRAVEAQHRLSTRKLVASAEEQELLEELLERVKPPETTGARLHYLLFTPFRYPPLRHGSRFGTRHERGIWYGAEHRRTAFAEVAYYRLVFLQGSAADLGTVTTPLTTFAVALRSSRAVDLTAAPFTAHRRAIASPSSYRSTQPLGAAMREAGVELCRYPSARDAEHGVNVAVFAPEAFGTAAPRRFESWYCIANRRRVELARGGFGARETYVFPRAQFLVDGTLPVPAA